jgi:hypothetical protein
MQAIWHFLSQATIDTSAMLHHSPAPIHAPCSGAPFLYGVRHRPICHSGDEAKIPGTVARQQDVQPHPSSPSGDISLGLESWTAMMYRMTSCVDGSPPKPRPRLCFATNVARRRWMALSVCRQHSRGLAKRSLGVRANGAAASTNVFDNAQCIPCGRGGTSRRQ